MRWGASSLLAAMRVFMLPIDRHYGRIANTAGDGLIADFPSVVEAVQCAVRGAARARWPGPGLGRAALQDRHPSGRCVDRRRRSVGEGVNLAARLQSMAEPGGILISQQVYDQVQKKLSVAFEYLG